jgi:CMP-N-acetylneuraminic acid synthetase
MGETRIAALVPMRHESERVKGKNYRPLAGRPLYHHIIGALSACPRIDEIVIDTDSDVIKADARQNFPDIRIIDRPPELRGDEVPMNDVLLHDVEAVAADLYLQTHSTNPLLRTETIETAIDAFLSAANAYDSLFSVTPWRTRLWTENGEAINHDPDVLLRTQDLPPVMEENSCLYIFRAQTLRDRGNRIGSHPLLFPIEGAEAWDIDEELDWQIVEHLHGLRGGDE